MLNTIMVDLIEIVVLVIVSICGKYIIPLIKSKLNEEKLKCVKVWVSTFVSAAEMLFCEEKKGEEKLNYATVEISKKLNDLNIKMTSEEIRALIEECVKELNANK